MPVTSDSDSVVPQQRQDGSAEMNRVQIPSNQVTLFISTCMFKK